MKQYGALDDTFYFWFGANDTSGSGGDGASPAADVRLAGAAADAAPVYSPTPVLLSHANYPAGAHEISIAATVANGFAANNTYAVFCTLLIDSQNPTGFVGSFDLKPVEANVTQIGDTTQSATDLKDFADAGYDPGTNKVQGVVLTDTVTTLTGHTAQTGDSFTRLGAPAGATIAADLVTIDNFVDELETRLSAARAGYLDELAAANLPSDIDDILLDTAEIGAAGVGLTDIPWNAAWDVEVESECNDALIALKLDHLLAVAVGGTGILSDQAVANCVVALLASDDGDPTGYAHADDSLEAIRDRGDAAWITGAGGTPAAVADAVWNEDLSDHTTSGTAGKIMSSIKKIVDVILGLIS